MFNKIKEFFKTEEDLFRDLSDKMEKKLENAIKNDDFAMVMDILNYNNNEKGKIEISEKYIFPNSKDYEEIKKHPKTLEFFEYLLSQDTIKTFAMTYLCTEIGYENLKPLKEKYEASYKNTCYEYNEKVKKMLTLKNYHYNNTLSWDDCDEVLEGVITVYKNKLKSDKKEYDEFMQFHAKLKRCFKAGKKASK